ncbi:hypothetical protein GCM10011380_19430 [Sphingomonas metalli]|uniref:Peptidase S11 D-alanyl-D-alanine carboxypeptidase A N-terminal domain-containing protein n=1 Tax=Sphingomonas metalli TaxID=1779358 RepID=A0A916T3S7_9SPHN|nr:D-alanyl-D-alanine carboxypeptidase family protein [Sphingomonas metalli]GGB30098.1 hypothetical protein GCM10011380_19430 [Sphingomonas metalli]
MPARRLLPAPVLRLIAAAALALPAAAQAAAPVSEIVIDAGSGRVLDTAAADRVRPPASLTKLMTLLLAFEALDRGTLRAGEQLRMSRHAAAQAPSKLGLAPGRRMGLQEAMRSVAVISANDVAVMLAERIAGSEPRFVAQMNRRARQLGMAHTRFANATGLAPAGGMTTARDMATLARYIVRSHPARYRLFATRSIRWRGQTRPNHNRLLGTVRGVDGMKTGYTVPAGYNLVASAVRRGRRMVVVVLGARTAPARDVRVANLIELGFSAPAKAAPTPARARARRRR